MSKRMRASLGNKRHTGGLKTIQLMQDLNKFELEGLDRRVRSNDDALTVAGLQQLAVERIVVALLEAVVLKRVHRLAHNRAELLTQYRTRELQQRRRDDLDDNGAKESIK